MIKQLARRRLNASWFFSFFPFLFLQNSHRIREVELERRKKDFLRLALEDRLRKKSGLQVLMEAREGLEQYAIKLQSCQKYMSRTKLTLSQLGAKEHWSQS